MSICRGQLWESPFTLGNKHDSLVLVSSWFRVALLTLRHTQGHRVVIESGQPRDTLKILANTILHQVCTYADLSPSTPTIRISYDTDRLLEYSNDLHLKLRCLPASENCCKMSR